MRNSTGFPSLRLRTLLVILSQGGGILAMLVFPAAAVALEAIQEKPTTLVWFSSGAGASSQATTREYSGYDADSRYLRIGIVRSLTDAFSGGVSVGRSWYDVDTSGREQDESNAIDIELRGRLSAGDYRVSGSLATRDVETDQAREFLFERGDLPRSLLLDARIDAREWIFNLSGSRDFDLGDTSFLSPEVSLTYISVSTDDFIETSSGLAGIEVRTADQDQWLAGTSLSGGTLWPLGDWVWLASGLVGVEWLVAGDRPRSESAFVGSRYAFTAVGYEQSDPRFSVGASLSAHHLGGMGASLGLVHGRQDGFHNTSLSLEIDYDF